MIIRAMIIRTAIIRFGIMRAGIMRAGIIDADRRDGRRIDVRQGRRRDTGCKRRGIELVVGMEHERDVERPRRQRTRPVAGEHVEKVRGMAESGMPWALRATVAPMRQYGVRATSATFSA